MWVGYHNQVSPVVLYLIVHLEDLLLFKVHFIELEVLICIRIAYIEPEGIQRILLIFEISVEVHNSSSRRLLPLRVVESEGPPGGQL